MQTENQKLKTRSHVKKLNFLEEENSLKDKRIWAYLLHLSYNLWYDREFPGGGWSGEHCAKPYLRCDDKLWDDIIKRSSKSGINMIVIDLGDGIKYESHPEIAVKDAWTIPHLKKKLAEIRSAGLEAIPKLNFSTAHDAWLGIYERQVSTDAYYKVCADLIAEVIALFDNPRFFHLGMDEETARHQKLNAYAVIRQHDLWWNDLYFLIEQVEKGNAHPWVWSDYAWNHHESFFNKMPGNVIQSNWYYGTDFSESNNVIKVSCDLARHGYSQILTGSNYVSNDNFEKTVDFGTKSIIPLLGFLQTTWSPTLEKFRDNHMQAIEQVEKATVKFLENNQMK